MEESARHLALLTRTIEVVNSSLDLQEVMEAIAHEVASALGTDACFVYLYDEPVDELVLRATHGTAVESETERPHMRPGEGITGAPRSRGHKGAVGAFGERDKMTLLPPIWFPRGGVDQQTQTRT